MSISIEEAVRQTMDALGIEDDEERIEDALTELMVIASAFGKERDYRAGWEEGFAGMYIRPLGFVGGAALLAHLDLHWREPPAGAELGDGATTSERLYMAAQTWLTLIVKHVFVRLGK